MMQDVKNNEVLLECGQFDTLGGWVTDTQFIPNMGAAVMMAHGLGRPVEDAEARFICSEGGSYRIWVWTRNWVAPWKEDVAPGVFQVLIDDVGVPTPLLGNENANWHWQDGGCVVLGAGEHVLRLHDLTGFEGRCGGIYITPDVEQIPRSSIDERIALRRRVRNNRTDIPSGAFDLIVAGGGISGMCAALSGARRGLKTLLIQDRPVLGGNNSSEVRVWLGGETNFEPYPQIGDIVRELEPLQRAHYGPENQGEIYEDDRRQALLENQDCLTVIMEHVVTDVMMEGSTIRGVQVLDIQSGLYKLYTGAIFVDATGDGTLGAMAGADYEVTTNGHMGMTNIWYVEDTGTEQEFPRCPWAMDLSRSKFPGRKDVASTYGDVGANAFGGWYWESGCEHDPIDRAEYARDTNFRAMYGAWDAVKNVDGDYPSYRLGFSAYIGGKRESRRLLGDLILTKSDVFAEQMFTDGCVPSTWSLDVHYPDRTFYAAFHEGDAFLTKDYHETYKTPFFIPYRCLYSRNIDNLLMAGRNVSVSHDALGTVRVMRTCGMMGEVVGMAASICRQHRCQPREVYTQHLNELIALMKQSSLK